MERGRMTREAPVINHEDVFALSAKGEEELRGAETSLSPAEIELLVRIDGMHSIGEIAEGMRLLAPDAVSGALAKLLDQNLVRLKFRERAGGITDLFVGKAPAPARGALAKARAQAATGVSSLQKNGYFVRIAK